ncbi:hypothetical protein HMPREF1885_01262 [Streptococcus agalactiae]|nr:hypothetical protein HMPREF1885_01262 [Streptococcus agalactiae]
MKASQFFLKDIRRITFSQKRFQNSTKNVLSTNFFAIMKEDLS